VKRKLLPLLLLTACAADDAPLPVLNTTQPEISYATPVDSVPDVPVSAQGEPDTQSVEQIPDPITETQEESGRVGEAVQYTGLPETTATETTGDEVDEPLQTETFPEGVPDDSAEIPAEPVAFEDALTIDLLEGQYTSEDIWTVPAFGRPVPEVKVIAQVIWVSNADGYDVILDGVYETTVTEPFFETMVWSAGELSYLDPRTILPTVTIRAWTSSQSVEQEVVW